MGCAIEPLCGWYETPLRNSVNGVVPILARLALAINAQCFPREILAATRTRERDAREQRTKE